MTRVRQTPKSEPTSNFPLLVCFHGAGMAPGNMAQGADEMFESLGRLGTAPEEAAREAGVSIKTSTTSCSSLRVIILTENVGRSPLGSSDGLVAGPRSSRGR